MELSATDPDITEVFRALGDSVRWSIVREVAAVDELPCAALETMLSVSKPTISYHTKILQHAGLLSVRKQGRNCFYAVRRDTLQTVLDQVRYVQPGLHPVGNSGRSRVSKRSERGRSVSGRRAAGGDDLVVLTW